MIDYKQGVRTDYVGPELGNLTRPDHEKIRNDNWCNMLAAGAAGYFLGKSSSGKIGSFVLATSLAFGCGFLVKEAYFGKNNLEHNICDATKKIETPWTGNTNIPLLEVNDQNGSECYEYVTDGKGNLIILRKVDTVIIDIKKKEVRVSGIEAKILQGERKTTRVIEKSSIKTLLWGK